jgi:hypothetical protein
LAPAALRASGRHPNSFPVAIAYETALDSKGNYYNFSDASVSSSPDEMQPDQTAIATLSFAVPKGINPDILILKSETTSNYIRIMTS